MSSFWLCAAALLLSLYPRTAPASCADLSLVLAIDASGSIDAGEFALQTYGYAAAFQDREVQRALAANGVVDVAVVYWADSDFGFQKIPWRRIGSAGDARSLAALIVSTPRRLAGDTDIGNGLSAALDMLDLPNRCSIRSVVNVSGDGRESVTPKRSPHVSLALARERAKRLGVTVNGLAVTNEDRSLEEFYQKNLITGPRAFVMSVDDFAAFGDAIKEKLLREVSLQVAASVQGQRSPPDIR